MKEKYTCGNRNLKMMIANLFIFLYDNSQMESRGAGILGENAKCLCVLLNS